MHNTNPDRWNQFLGGLLREKVLEHALEEMADHDREFVDQVLAAVREHRESEAERAERLLARVQGGAGA